MIRKLLLLLLLPAAMMAQERSLLPVVSPPSIIQQEVYGTTWNGGHYYKHAFPPIDSTYFRLNLYRGQTDIVLNDSAMRWITGSQVGTRLTSGDTKFALQAFTSNGSGIYIGGYGSNSMGLHTNSGYENGIFSRGRLTFRTGMTAVTPTATTNVYAALPIRMTFGVTGSLTIGSRELALSKLHVDSGAVRVDSLIMTGPEVISAPNGTATVKTLVVDSARMRVTVIDTTGWVTLDSLQYRISKIETPVTRTFGVATQHFKVGFVEIDIHGNCAQGGAKPQYFNLRTDSANGVKFAGMEMDYNWESYASGNYMILHYAKFSAWIANNNGLYTSGTATQINGGGVAVVPMPVQTGSASYFRYYIANNSNHTLYTAKFRVKVYMLVTSSSTWYVRPTNS